MVDRREYVPYCPLCATIFTSSAEIHVLSCKHFLCANCLALMTAHVCPFCKEPVQSWSGEFLGDAVAFLATWVTEVEQGRDRNTIVDQLIEQILMVRKNLKCSDLPCRIQAEGRMCTQVFKCPYDHKLLKYKKAVCDIPRCPYGDRCLFTHPPPPPPKPVSQPSNQPEESKVPAPSQSTSPNKPTTSSSQAAKKGGPKKAGPSKPGSKKGGEPACCLLS